MTAPENFVSRWARLKSESDTEPVTELVGYGPGQEEVVASVGTETPFVKQQDEMLGEPFDPASLPSIETITVDTDIRGFLQSRVPAALTRAALRQAWASDPAIRDFIGIAENQWDFNDPNAMPGFGPLLEGDRLPELLAQALGSRDRLAQMIAAVPGSAAESLPDAVDHEPAALDRNAEPALDISPPAERVVGV